MGSDFIRIEQSGAGHPALRWMIVGAVMAVGGLAVWRAARRPATVEPFSGADPVDQSSEDSFPASDPPSFNARGPSE
jgi:hypothetical protein